MSLWPTSRTDVRKKSYKTGIDADEARRRREDNLVEIRKNKREDNLLKKRREGLVLQSQQLSSTDDSQAQADIGKKWMASRSEQSTWSLSCSQLPLPPRPEQPMRSSSLPPLQQTEQPMRSSSLPPFDGPSRQLLMMNLGVVNVVMGNAPDIGNALLVSPQVRKITFTGSTAVGKKLMEGAAKTVKKVSLELGGNAPCIIFDDADLDVAVKGALGAKFRNSRQTCVCANRVLVQEGIYEKFAKAFSNAVQNLQVGDGFSEGVAQVVS